jgi:hypothetical protein
MIKASINKQGFVALSNDKYKDYGYSPNLHQISQKWGAILPNEFRSEILPSDIGYLLIEPIFYHDGSINPCSGVTLRIFSKDTVQEKSWKVTELWEYLANPYKAGDMSIDMSIRVVRNSHSFIEGMTNDGFLVKTIESWEENEFFNPDPLFVYSNTPVMGCIKVSPTLIQSTRGSQEIPLDELTDQFWSESEA